MFINIVYNDYYNEKYKSFKNSFEIFNILKFFKDKIGNNSKNESDLKIFIMTHKDFTNYRNNPVYNIVADEAKQLKENYTINIIYANKSKLYNMSRAYSEFSKLYYIYQLYKYGIFNNKYIGLNHYRRYFNFTDNIPDLDSIFKDYNIILSTPLIFEEGIKEQFCRYVMCKKYDEMLDIIKDIKPEYYETAININTEKKFYPYNLFIMKKNDFLIYCEFIYEILFEFDKRNNFTSDGDMLNYTKQFYNSSDSQIYQSRIQAFLGERLSNIYYYKNFKKIKTFDSGNYKLIKRKRDKKNNFILLLNI